MSFSPSKSTREVFQINQPASPSAEVNLDEPGPATSSVHQSPSAQRPFANLEFRLPEDYDLSNPKWHGGLAKRPVGNPTRTGSPMLYSDRFSGLMVDVPQRYDYLEENFHLNRPRSPTRRQRPNVTGRRGLTPIQLRVIHITINHPESLEARAFQQIQAAADTGTGNDALSIQYYRGMSPTPGSNNLMGNQPGQGRVPYQLIRQTYQNNTFRASKNFITGVTHPKLKVVQHYELPDGPPTAVLDLPNNRHFSPERTAKALPARCIDQELCRKVTEPAQELAQEGHSMEAKVMVASPVPDIYYHSEWTYNKRKYNEWSKRNCSPVPHR